MPQLKIFKNVNLSGSIKLNEQESVANLIEKTCAVKI
jgi:hypothetical protein